MRIRVTTTTPGYTSLLTKAVQKVARGNLVDLPWCFVGNVAGDWTRYDPPAFAKAAAAAPGDDVVLDCELLYAFTNANGQQQRYRVGLDTWLDNKAASLDALRQWGRVAAACAAAGKRLWSYPSWPLPLGIDIDSMERHAAYGDMSAVEWVRVGRFLAGGMVPCYVQRDMADFARTLDFQLSLCAVYGVPARMVLCSAAYEAIQDQGWAASFIGEKNVLDTARAVRARGLDCAFFNPAYPAAVDAIAKAAAEL